MRRGNARINADILHLALQVCSSVIASSSAPVTTRPPFCSRPNSRATACAVTGWSPVIITGRMPACFADRNRLLWLPGAADRSCLPAPERSCRLAPFPALASGFVGNRQHAQRLARHLMRALPSDLRASGIIQRLQPICRSVADRRRLKITSGAPLEYAVNPVLGLVQGGHALGFG